MQDRRSLKSACCRLSVGNSFSDGRQIDMDAPEQALIVVYMVFAQASVAFGSGSSYLTQTCSTGLSPVVRIDGDQNVTALARSTVTLFPTILTLPPSAVSGQLHRRHTGMPVALMFSQACGNSNPSCGSA